MSPTHTYTDRLPFSREQPTRLQSLHGCAHVMDKEYSNFSQVHSHLYAGNKSCLVTKIDVQLKQKLTQKEVNEEKHATSRTTWHVMKRINRCEAL